MKNKWGIIAAGAAVGAISVLLVAFGNPANMGFCIACFLRDTVGALGMHRAEAVQYVRPEIIGLIFGAFIVSLVQKEFAPKGGSAPLTRFVLGVCVMVGALMFLGCPLRMMLRIAGGDGNAIIGLFGFCAGILAGVFFLNKGFSLKRSYTLPRLEAVIPHVASAAVFAILLFIPSLLLFSEKGPGSMRAPIAIALIAGLGVGAIAQKTRLCTVAGFRDAFMFKDWRMLCGFIAIVAAAFAGNLLTGNFHPGFADQPVAHTDGVWNFFGLALVGFASVLLGGCPLRQLILTGSGNSDSAITVLGLMAGAAFCHNFGLASSADGPTLNGRIAVVCGLVIVLVIAAVNSKKEAAQA